MSQDNTQNQAKPGNTQPTLLTVDDKTYNVDSIPDEVKILVNDLIRVNQELGELQYRLRHGQAAQQTYVATIKAELERLNIPPYESPIPSD
jgi:hypothetical protein